VSPGTKAASVTTTAILALLLGAFSQWPTHEEPRNALIRLSWRTEPARIEECRRLTPEELAEIPAHMRRAEECVGDFVDYVLTADIDGTELLVDTISPSGLRRDRPVYVLRDLPVDPGTHRLAVTFSPLVPAGAPSPAAGFTPLRLEDEVSLDEGEIALVTLDVSETLVRRGGR
jgi:hypothetical protein